MIAGVTDLAPLLGVADACTTLGVPRSSYYRAIQLAPTPEVDDAGADAPSPAPRPRPARSLSDAERSQVRELLNSERFVDSAPRTVYAILLDEQQYWCSWRTMYRILAEAHEVTERRNQIRRTGYAAPELLATQPNQLWSWDITKLRGPATWTYYAWRHERSYFRRARASRVMLPFTVRDRANQEAQREVADELSVETRAVGAGGATLSARQSRAEVGHPR
jgi:hypothetical protein